MNNAIPILGQKKKTMCPHCGMHSHPFTTKCDYNALRSRVERLSEQVNMMGPLLQANKEATDLANMFRKIAKDSAMAIAICETTVKEFPNGDEIWKKFQERLEKEWPTLSQGTEEKANLSNQKNTIQNETENSSSTEETTGGETSAESSSHTTQSATPVAQNLQ